jgi:hypothetical protein
MASCRRLVCRRQPPDAASAAQILMKPAAITEKAMLMRVRECGDRILVELDGVDGRQQAVLRALDAYRRGGHSDEALAVADVTVRTCSKAMRISLRARQGQPVTADTVYRCLREGLYPQPLAAEPA